jgi:hypothetical protein
MLSVTVSQKSVSQAGLFTFLPATVWAALIKPSRLYFKTAAGLGKVSRKLEQFLQLRFMPDHFLLAAIIRRKFERIRSLRHTRGKTVQSQDQGRAGYGSRRARIASGSGRPVHEVNQPVKHFLEMRKMMKRSAVQKLFGGLM